MVHGFQTLIATLILGAGLGGATAFAAEVAGDGAGGAVRSTVNRGLLKSSDAARLINGELANVSSVTIKYRGGGATARCIDKWGEFMQKPVFIRPVGVSLDTLRANAARANLSQRKLQNALAVYLKNQNRLPNQKYLTIVDFDKAAHQPRLFTIELATGRIDKFFVSSSWGSSPPKSNGYSTHFSNRVDESNANSLGCAIASGEYRGVRHRRSLVLHGMEKTNDNMCRRSIIMHSADYVGKGGPSRSEGCLAIQQTDERELFKRIGGGGLICSYREGSISQARGYFVKPGRRRHAQPSYVTPPRPRSFFDLF